MNALGFIKWLAILSLLALALCCWGCASYPDIIGEQPNIGGLGE
jgi:hypothetical protein